MHSRFLILIALFALLAGFLVYQSTRETSALIKLPGELAALPSSESLVRIRVPGRVAPASVQYTVQPSMKLTFQVRNPGTPLEAVGVPTIPVVYEGIKPDMFTEGRDVILDGEYRGGVFYASKLLTQCPSKYEPPVPK